MSKETQKLELGMVGLGVMGRNLVLNIADNGFSVAGYDKDLSKAEKDFWLARQCDEVFLKFSMP